MTDDQIRPFDGVITKTKAGAVTDADFVVPPTDGTIAVDVAGARLYVRAAGTWKSVGLA